MGFWEKVASSSFMPHGHCYLWRPEVLWLMVGSDALIVAAYFSIPVALAVFVQRRRDIAFPGIFLLFSAFIFACGTTHLMAIFTTWRPWYFAEGLVKLATGIVSVTTAIVLWPLLPKALALPSPQQLREVNSALQGEVEQRREAEQRLRSLAADLEARVEQRTAQLRLANAELEGFASAVSHDLQEPLRAIVSYAQILAEEAGDRLDDSHRQYLGEVVRGGAHMHALVRELLHYARLGGEVPAGVAADAGEALELALATLRPRLTESDGVVEHGPLPRVRAEPRQLGLVFQNLISNSIKYRSEAPPKVRIEARREGDSWHFSVQDNGQGLDMRHAQEIFEPFRRLHREGEGTGMGLAIARRILERSGGGIRVESEPGRGATFHFVLPAARLA